MIAFTVLVAVAAYMTAGRPAVAVALAILAVWLHTHS
jgi:hypothetical protein